MVKGFEGDTLEKHLVRQKQTWLFFFFAAKCLNLLNQLIYTSLLVDPKYFFDFDLKNCFGIIIFQIVEHVSKSQGNLVRFIE